jgi:hypothetical protein
MGQTAEVRHVRHAQFKAKTGTNLKQSRVCKNVMWTSDEVCDTATQWPLAQPSIYCDILLVMKLFCIYVECQVAINCRYRSNETRKLPEETQD